MARRTLKRPTKNTFGACAVFTTADHTTILPGVYSFSDSKLWHVPVYSFVRITPPRRRRSNKPNGDVPPCWRHSSRFRCVGRQKSKGRFGPHFVASWCQGTTWSSVEGPRAVQWQLENTFVEQCCRHHHHLPSCDSLILQRKKFRTTFFFSVVSRHQYQLE